MSDKDKDKEKEKEKTESKPGDLGLLEEDDEFEEFPAEGENLLVHSLFNGPWLKTKCQHLHLALVSVWKACCINNDWA